MNSGKLSQLLPKAYTWSSGASTYSVFWMSTVRRRSPAGRKRPRRAGAGGGEPEPQRPDQRARPAPAQQCRRRRERPRPAATRPSRSSDVPLAEDWRPRGRGCRPGASRTARRGRQPGAHAIAALLASLGIEEVHQARAHDGAAQEMLVRSSCKGTPRGPSGCDGTHRRQRSAPPTHRRSSRRPYLSAASRRSATQGALSPMLVIFLCIGLAAGVLSGMFGLGGGILIVPALVLPRQFLHPDGARDLARRAAAARSGCSGPTPTGTTATWTSGPRSSSPSGLFFGDGRGGQSWPRRFRRATLQRGIRRVHRRAGHPALARRRGPHEAREQRRSARASRSPPSTAATARIARRRSPGARSRSTPGASR